MSAVSAEPQSIVSSSCCPLPPALLLSDPKNKAWQLPLSDLELVALSKAKAGARGPSEAALPRGRVWHASGQGEAGGGAPV